MLDFLWNVGQEAKLHRQGTQIDSAKEVATHAKLTNAETELKLARLSLLCEALWEIVKAETGRKDADLVAIMSDLDLSDGKRDGKKTRKPTKCVKCDRVYQKGRSRCIFCGAQNPGASPFEQL